MPSRLLVLLGYVLVSFLYFGVRLLPHPGRWVIGFGRDPDLFVWSVAWWPHAILHGENPFFTHAIWAPDGLNLAWTTSVPGIALAVAPVTLAFGPVVGYNTAAILLPALAAWTGFVLCRHITGRLWPSIVGGYLFGFSSYMLGQQLGHLHMTSVFLVPLVALVVLRFVEGELDGSGLTWRLGVLLGAQIYLSTELLFTLSLSLVVALALAYATLRALRPRLRALLRPLAGAFALAAAIASPLLAYALIDFEPGTLNPPELYNADLLNLVVPTRLIGIGGGVASGLVERFPGNDAERSAYLGLPILAIVAWFVLIHRRRPTARFLTLAAAVPAAAALGTAFWVGGYRVVPLPWDLVSRLPLFNNVLPSRFALFTSLATAVIVALWSVSPRVPRWARIMLPAAAVASLVPTLRQADWLLKPERPEFFAHTNLVEACLEPNENVLIYPYSWRGGSMLWQAENDFRFRMAEGYLRPDAPKSFERYRAVRKSMHGDTDPTVPEIVALARAKDVSRILSLEVYQHPSAKALEQVGPYQVLGGVIVAPACGHPGIAERSRSSST